jgi:cytochrome c-type biogenesis protein
VELGAASAILAFVAGALSTLSPCVLPLIPIVVASALAQHRWGVWMLAVGLAASFTVAGLFVATVGVSIGVDATVLRRLAGLLLVFFGLVMALPALQARFAAATAGLAGGGQAGLARLGGVGWTGQLAVGALLGVVWTPCVGPTLGAAATLASQGRQLGDVALLMAVFGIGAATPLVVFGLAAQRVRAGSRRAWLAAAGGARRAVGMVLVMTGAAIAAGADKPIETWLVDHSPDWLTLLTTRF